MSTVSLMGAGSAACRSRVEPRRLATAWELRLPGSMQWITSVQPQASKAQSMAAVAPSVA
jgi:hypothetical protein